MRGCLPPNTPDMQVLTFGPGQLAFAHSDHEQIALDEIRAAAEFLRRVPHSEANGDADDTIIEPPLRPHSP